MLPPKTSLPRSKKSRHEGMSKNPAVNRDLGKMKVKDPAKYNKFMDKVEKKLKTPKKPLEGASPAEMQKFKKRVALPKRKYNPVDKNR